MSTFKIEGLNDLNRVFDELGGARSRVVFREGANKTAAEILAESQRNLKANGSHVTGKTFKSGRFKNSNEDGIGAEVYYDADYAIYLEFGRRAGKMPPLNEITAWVVKKGLADTYDVRKTIKKKGQTIANPRYKQRYRREKGWTYKAMSIAFLIAKSISKKGTKARPFLYPAFEAKKGNLWRNISEAYQKMIDTIKV